jgi:hypothetical protein
MADHLQDEKEPKNKSPTKETTETVVMTETKPITKAHPPTMFRKLVFGGSHTAQVLMVLSIGLICAGSIQAGSWTSEKREPAELICEYRQICIRTTAGTRILGKN